MFDKKGMFNKLKNIAEATVDTAKNVVAEQRNNYEENKNHQLKIEPQLQEEYKKELTVLVQQQFSNLEDIQIASSSQQLELQGNVINISESHDLFNAYRIVFRTITIQAIESLKIEYDKKINDLNDFLNYYEIIYDTYYNAIAQKAVGILLSKDIWTVTQESFVARGKELSSYGLQAFNLVLAKINELNQANQKILSSVTSIGASMLGKQTNGNQFANQFIGACADNISNTNIGVTYAQQQQLYQNIDKDNIFKMVFADYLGISAVLVRHLIENGEDIWIPDEISKEQANNLFQNITNPSFPQDKIPEALCSILSMSPYNEDYFRFIVSKYGKNDETLTLINYFGMSDVIA